MDQAKCEDSGEVLDRVDERVDENLDHLVGGVEVDAGAGGSLCDRVSVSGEDETSEEICSDDQGTSYNSRDLVSGEVLDTCVIIDDPSASIEHVNRKLEAKANNESSGLSKMSMMKAPKGVSETDKNSCVIDMKRGSCTGFNANSEGEMICRICHLASGQPLEATGFGFSSADSSTSTDLIQLGCACKDELGIAHSHCAEAWFKLKGNRLCEICGETAKNVSDIIDNGFMEEWNETRFIDNHNNMSTTSSRMFRGCWRGQPFCNFLMACLVIAFVLPWFFHVNMF